MTSTTNTTSTDQTTFTMTAAELEAKLAAARDEGAIKALMSAAKDERGEDEKLRRDPVIRVHMSRMIEELAELVQDTAADINRKQGGSMIDPFSVDHLADVVLWQLVEYLMQCQIDRTPASGSGYEDMARAHQLTEWHAAFWFATSPTERGIVADDSALPDVQ